MANNAQPAKTKANPLQNQPTHDKTDPKPSPSIISHSNKLAFCKTLFSGFVLLFFCVCVFSVFFVCVLCFFLTTIVGIYVISSIATEKLILLF